MQCGLDRTELTLFPFSVDYDFVGRDVDCFGDGFSVRAKDDAANSDARMMRDVHEVLQKRAALIGKESLGRTHAARRTAGENNGCEHGPPSALRISLDLNFF